MPIISYKTQDIILNDKMFSEIRKGFYQILKKRFKSNKPEDSRLEDLKNDFSNFMNEFAKNYPVRVCTKCNKEYQYHNHIWEEYYCEICQEKKFKEYSKGI